MTSLTVKFSPEYEVERIRWTLSKLQWYRDNGYNLKFPESLDVDSGADISEEQIRNAVNAEYDEESYKNQETYLLENWHKIFDEASSELSKTSLQPLGTYTIYLVRYGVGGSYHYPDSVTVNISSKYEKGLLRTVFHEITHLMIHPWISEYKVSHWQKERIVDLLTMKFTPQISKMQDIPAEVTEPVDEIFNEHYPDIQLAIKNVGQIPK